MEEARKAIAEGTELCRRWDREALGWSNTFSVSLAAWGGEPPGPDTLVHGRRAVEIAEEIGDAFSRIVAYSWLSLAHNLVGDSEEAMQVADHCLGMIAERGAGLEFEPTVRGVRAEAFRAQGDLDEAVEEGELALRLVRGTGHQLHSAAHPDHPRRDPARPRGAGRHRAGRRVARRGRAHRP